MINRFSKMRDSIFTKIILTVTALSFVSLFGVSGYINTANSNKAVIQVDNLELTQSQFAYLLQRDILRLKAAGNIDLDEDDDKKTQIADSLLKIKLDEMILDNTMQKYDIDIRETLVYQILKMLPQFQTAGAFDAEKYKTYKDITGKSDEEILQDTKRKFIRVFMLDYPVAFTNVPRTQLEQMAKILGQRRTFRYIKIENSAAKIDRKPTTEELSQYYEDMDEELMVPEKRDLNVLYIPQEKLTAAIEIPQDEIDAYYKEHISEFEQGEQRAVMQMVFDSEQKANAAYDSLNSGKTFAEVAEENGQNAGEIDLGFVGADDVSDELSEVIFSLEAGKYSAPVKIADSWQILEVTDIKQPSKVARSEADAQIAEELRQDKAYDNNYDVLNNIEDKLGAGSSLEEIAEAYGAKIYQVQKLDEEGKAESTSGELSDVLTNKDFLDIAFSYNENETGQAVETNDGIAVATITKIYDAHKMPFEEAENILNEVWLENERASITGETVDNIENDLQAGDDLSKIASRYNLKVINSRPVTRNENIDKISFVEMKKLFSAPKNEAQIIKLGEDYVVAETTNIYDDSDSIKGDKKEELKQTLYEEEVNELAEILLQDFAKDYKIKVNYNRIGLED